MDDDKDLIEKTIEAVKNIATSVTAAAKHAVEPEPVKSGGGQVVFMPMAGDGFADPLMSPMPMTELPKSKGLGRPVCTENLIGVDDVTESPKLAE